MELINGGHADNYNDSYFFLLSENLMEQALVDLNTFITGIALESEIVTEEVSVRDINKGDNKKTTTLIERIKKLIANLIKFVKNIIMAFINKVDDLIRSNDAWLDKNTWKINGISDDFWNQCDITIYPYDFKNKYAGNNVFTEDIYSQAIKSIDSSEVERAVNTGFDSKGEMYEYLTPKIYKINPDDFTMACKAFYRGSNTLFSFNGSEAEKVCVRGAKFLDTYKDLSNKIKSDLNKFRGKVERFERESLQAAKQNVNESFLLEDFMGYEIAEELMDGRIARAKAASGVTAQNERKTNGGLTMDTDRNGERNDDKSESQPTKTSSTQQKFNRQLEYWRTVLTIQTARMTIAEEAYNAYLRTIKTVVRTAESRKQISANKAQKVEKGVVQRTKDYAGRVKEKITGRGE